MNTYKWQFKSLQPADRLREGGHITRQLFSGEHADKTKSDTEGYARTLVREAIQNSLDAQADDSEQPVVVTFGIGNFFPAGGDIQCFEGLSNHFSAKSIRNNYKTINEKLSSNTQSRFLTIEDTGTTGLYGNRKLDGIERFTNPTPFTAFFRADGQSSKTETSRRGSNGVGKSSFFMLSDASIYFAVSTPKNHDDELLGGLSALPAHSVDNSVVLSGDIAFNHLVDVLTTTNPNDASFIKSFRQKFMLQRKQSDYGLSIVVPFLQESVTLENIRESIFSEWFHAILSGSLVVRLVNHTSQGNYEEINQSNFLEKISDSVHRIYSQLCKKIIEGDANSIKLGEEYQTVINSFKSGSINLNLSEAKISQFQEAYDQGDILVFEPFFWMKIKAEDGKATSTNRVSFKIAFKNNHELSNSNSRNIFVRDDLVIRPRNLSVGNSFVYVHVTDPVLSELFRRTEGASHDRFTPGTQNPDQRFNITAYATDARSVFSGVFDVSEALLKMLQGNEAEKLRGTLFDSFFSISTPKDIRYKDTKTPQGPQVNKGKGGHPKKTTSYFISSPIEKGFVVHLNDPFKIPEVGRKFVTQVGYKTANSATYRSITSSGENGDFEFKDHDLFPITQIEGIKLIDRIGNKVEFEITGDEPQFCMTGFDGYRDTVVDTKPAKEK